MIGMGWGLLVFFIIPVIATDGVGGFAAIRRSSSIIRDKLGEAVVGTAGMGLVMFLISVVAAGPFFLICWLNFQGSGAVNVLAGNVFVAIGVVVILGMTVFSSSLNSTYRAVRFNYANTGKTGGFNKDTLDHAFSAR
jgi:hypothetical protein